MLTLFRTTNKTSHPIEEASYGFLLSYIRSVA